MKRFGVVSSLAALVAAVVVLSFPAESRAQHVNSAQPSLEYVLWDPGLLGTTEATAVASGVLKTHSIDRMKILVENTSEEADRIVTVSCLAPDETDTLFSFDPVTVSTASSAMIVFDPALTTATSAPTGATFFSVEPCVRTKVSAASAAGQVRFLVTGRKGR